MINKIVQNIKRYNLIKEHANIFVGVSGGSDSMCLLSILLQIKNNNFLGYNFNLKAVHIDHKLRGEESTNDRLFVENFCKQNDIDLVIFETDIKKLSITNKKTIEETAREFRFKKFNELLENQNDKIALAHNFSDNAETLLMHLFRGSGLNGLLGMNFCDDNIIRPLIKTKKEDILLFLEKHNIAYCTDKTNFQEIYARNKVRLTLIPYLEKNFNSNIIDSLNNTIDTLRTDNDYIEKNVSIAYDKISSISQYKNRKMVKLKLDNLKEVHTSILARIFIRAFCEINGSNVDLNSKNISDLRSLINKETGKTIRLNKKYIALKGYEYMYFIDNCCLSYNNLFNKYISLNKLTHIEDNLYIYIGLSKKDFDGYTTIKTKSYYFNKEQQFYVRTKKDNDKFFIKTMNGHKTLKKYFQENKIDTIFRNDIKILSTDDNLIMILDKMCISTDNFNSGNIEYCIQILNKNGGF